MSLLLFALITLIVVGAICAVVYQIPWPVSLVWLRWAIPLVALVIALVLILQRLGIA